MLSCWFSFSTCNHNQIRKEEYIISKESSISESSLEILESMGYDSMGCPTSSYDHMSDEVSLLRSSEDWSIGGINEIVGDHRDCWENPEVEACLQMGQSYPLLTMKGEKGYSIYAQIGELYAGLDYLTRGEYQ